MLPTKYKQPIPPNATKQTTRTLPKGSRLESEYFVARRGGMNRILPYDFLLCTTAVEKFKQKAYEDWHVCVCVCGKGRGGQVEGEKMVDKRRERERENVSLREKRGRLNEGG